VCQSQKSLEHIKARNTLDCDQSNVYSITSRTLTADTTKSAQTLLLLLLPQLKLQAPLLSQEDP